MCVKPGSRLAHSCHSLSLFWQHEAARSISTSPGQNASPLQVASPQFVRFLQQLTGTHLYTWVERGTVRVNFLAEEHHSVPGQGSSPDHSIQRRQCTKHETTKPPHIYYKCCIFHWLRNEISGKCFLTHLWGLGPTVCFFASGAQCCLSVAVC